MSDMTPDQARAAILDAALRAAVFDGWTDVTLERAAKTAGLPPGAAALYFPDGVMGALSYWSKMMDASARAQIEALDLASMKIRDRVTQAVIIRLSQFGDHQDAAQRAQSRLSLPDSVSTAASIGWSASDMIWRAIGDVSTDGNFYSKRTVLSAVLASTVPVWLNDEDADKTKAKAFLDRRIQNVMQFEIFKGQVRKATAQMPNPAEILGRMRYGRMSRGVPTRCEKRRVRRGR